jgi:hypothetical protein
MYVESNYIGTTSHIKFETYFFPILSVNLIFYLIQILVSKWMTTLLSARSKYSETTYVLQFTDDGCVGPKHSTNK